MKVGDSVSYINDTGGGIVEKIQGNRIFLKDDHGFEHIVGEEELVVVKKDLSQMMRHDFVPQKEEQKLKSKKHSKNHKERQFVDLHLHEILENSSGMDNFQKLNYQVNYAQNKLAIAKKRRVRFVVLIHGKGTGKLRTEIRKMLKSQDIVSYYDVSYDQISGATEVQIY